MILLPPHIASLSFLSGLLLHWLLPGLRLLPGLPLMGLIFLALGVGLVMWAFNEFQKHKTPVIPTSTPTAFVADGPYRFTRNPMYLGLTLILASIGFWIGSLPLLLAAPAFLLIINQTYIPYEEAKLKRIFGTSYEQYLSKVRRWI